jgi:hypothetical protein
MIIGGVRSHQGARRKNIGAPTRKPKSWMEWKKNIGEPDELRNQQV